MVLIHEEVQTCASIVMIGLIGILSASFFTDKSFLNNIDWIWNPITHFMVGGLLLIISGCALLLYYQDRNRNLASKTYGTTSFLGLVILIIASVHTLVRYLVANL